MFERRIDHLLSRMSLYASPHAPYRPGWQSFQAVTQVSIRRTRAGVIAGARRTPRSHCTGHYVACIAGTIGGTTEKKDD